MVIHEWQYYVNILKWEFLSTILLLWQCCGKAKQLWISVTFCDMNFSEVTLYSFKGIMTFDTFSNCYSIAEINTKCITIVRNHSAAGYMWPLWQFDTGLVINKIIALQVVSKWLYIADPFKISKLYTWDPLKYVLIQSSQNNTQLWQSQLIQWAGYCRITFQLASRPNL